MMTRARLLAALRSNIVYQLESEHASFTPRAYSPEETSSGGISEKIRLPSAAFPFRGPNVVRISVHNSNSKKG